MFYPTILAIVTLVQAQVGNAPIFGSIPQISKTSKSVYEQLESMAGETNGPNEYSSFFHALGKFPTLIEVLKSNDCTIFVPSNTALLPVLTAPDRLERLLSYHILPSRVDLCVKRQYLKSANGETLIMLSNINAFSVEHANTVNPVSLETSARNGFVFTVSNNGMLLPPPTFLELVEIGHFKMFMDMIRRVNMVSLFSGLRDVSVFIPVDGAFHIDNSNSNRTHTEWAQILMNHVTAKVSKADMTGKTDWLVPSGHSHVTIKNDDFLFSNYTVKGTGNTVGSNIVQFDVLGSFGYVHTIDRLLLPATFASTVPVFNTPRFPVASNAISNSQSFLLLVVFYILGKIL